MQQSKGSSSGLRWRGSVLLLLLLLSQFSLLQFVLPLERLPVQLMLAAFLLCCFLPVLLLGSFKGWILSLVVVLWMLFGVGVWVAGASLWPLHVFVGGVLFYSSLRLKKSVFRFPKSAVDFLSRLSNGPVSEELDSPLRDERGLIHRTLNRFAANLKEKELLSQYIAPEIWQEIQRDTSHSLMAAREQQALVLSLVGQPRHLDTARSFMELGCRLASECRGFVAQHREDMVQIAFLEETEGYEKNALMAMSRVRTLLSPGQNASLCRMEVKTGLMNREQGLRLKVFGSRMLAEVSQLKSMLGQPSQCFLHDSVKGAAERIFHLAEPNDRHYLPIEGEKDLEFHLNQLRSARVEDKLVSIRVVESHGDPATCDLLKELLHDVSPRVRIEAAKALSRLVSPKTESSIGQAYLKALAEEWNHDCRATLVISLGELRRKEFVEPLFGLLQDANDRVRANAVEAIGKCMDRNTVVRYLESMLQDKNNRARANAALALWLMGMKKGFLELLQMAQSEDALICCSGLYGIGEIFQESNIAIVESHLSHPSGFWLKERETLFRKSTRVALQHLFHSHPLVERNALLALRKIGSRTAVDDILLKFRRSQDENIRQMALQTLQSMDEFQLVSRLRQEMAL